MLREAGEFENTVVSCGGGTPCFHDNMNYMLSRGDVIWLEASPERITERLIINNARRPLMRGKTPEEIRHSVEEGLATRHKWYSLANIRFNGEHLEDKLQIDTSVTNFLQTYKFSQ